MAIKKILLKFLGEKKYLSLLAFSFQRLYKAGLLGREYRDVYFLRKIIRPGDYCIDIGAHLGYFSIPLSRLVGPGGKIYSIEPMSAFHNTLKRLLQRKKADNVTLYQVALGGKGEFVEMGIPDLGEVKHFAYARIVESSPYYSYNETEQVRNESGDRLFGDLPRLDYVKIDVEGLEYSVLSSMLQVLRKHHPILVCEVCSPDQRAQLAGLLGPIGYRPYALLEERLLPIDLSLPAAVQTQNDYFLPQQRLDTLRPLIKD
jgi:FkbM family methyltransferase